MILLGWLLVGLLSAALLSLIHAALRAREKFHVALQLAESAAEPTPKTRPNTYRIITKRITIAKPFDKRLTDSALVQNLYFDSLLRADAFVLAGKQSSNVLEGESSSMSDEAFYLDERNTDFSSSMYSPKVYQ